MAVEHDRLKVPETVSDEYAPGFKGFIQGARSLLTGLGITARASRRTPVTVRYPAEKLAISSRWRGPLYLRGAMGRDAINLISAPPDEYNGVIDGLYREERLQPCTSSCPANVDARGQAFLVAENRAPEAYELVRERNILPGVLGRICHHPCETVCRRNSYDEPVSIRPLHRFAYEEYRTVASERIKPLPQTRGKRVAIVGAGPSGLTAAHDLMRLGYTVAMYERESTPGGALSTGVPSYRLPRDVLYNEIDNIVAMGLDLQCGVKVGTDVMLADIMRDNDAVLIAVGLQQSRILPLPGTDAEGVMGALEFLRAVNNRVDTEVAGKRVLVIGGGNVAVDVARCALRVGASEVRLACLEGDSEMPCHPWEIEEAVDEGVIAMCSLGPVEVLSSANMVTGMRMRPCLSVFDEAGRFAPSYGDGTTDVETDVVVFSIGQAAVLDDLLSGTELLVSDRGQLVVDGVEFTTSVPGVFACGEVVSGPGSAIGSIATGHEAATSVHRYLDGQSLTEGRVPRPVPVPEKYGPVDFDYVEPERRRAVIELVDAEERVTDFRVIEPGLTREQAMAEAARCLRCESEVCVGCTFCARTCPDFAIQVERIDEPGSRCLTKYELDLTKCCFCGLCAEQCPTGALQHTGQYELSFYHRELMTFDKGEMLRDGGGTRATGLDGTTSPKCVSPSTEAGEAS